MYFCLNAFSRSIESRLASDASHAKTSAISSSCAFLSWVSIDSASSPISSMSHVNVAYNPLSRSLCR